MKKIGMICLLLVMSLTACQIPQEEGVIRSEEKPEKLVVYAIGDHVSCKSAEGERTDYYCTNYTIGPFGPVVNDIRERGYIYHDAFQEFERETGITLEIQYFISMNELEQKVLEDKKSGMFPDVLVMDQRIWAGEAQIDNIYRIIEEEWFFDLKPYADQDELYTTEQYYETVLKAGVYQGKQLILPLSFNIKAIFTSDQEMEDIGVYLYQEMNGREILIQMQEACMRAEKGEVAVDTLSLWSSMTAIIPIFWESTGLDPVDYEEQTVTLDQDLFEEMAIFIKSYFKQDMEEEWQEVVRNASSYLNSEHWTVLSVPSSEASLDNQKDTISMMQEQAKAWLDNGSFYIESNSESMYRHGFAGQCMALDTLYDEKKEEMKMVGISKYEESDAYIAEIQMMGGVMKESKNPYHAYQLLKYIADHDYAPYYSVSISKKVTADMLDELEKMTYTLYLGLSNAWAEEIDFSKEREEYQYTLNPLKSERREQIAYMLDHVAGAVLPQCSIYMPISWHLQAYALEYETLGEAYEGACRDLEKALAFTLAGE
ncbi:MAG: extracellular solute-binding protein [Lachnospiraceae bacterium]|jgi:hypothetical protein|nr:extracellular solute-binding protein [Lachnospiraceae bacterium]